MKLYEVLLVAAAIFFVIAGVYFIRFYSRLYHEIKEAHKRVDEKSASFKKNWRKWGRRE